MSRCEQINELISGYLDDELIQSDFQRVEVHLRSCESCRETKVEMEKLRTAVADSTARSDLEDEQWEKIMNDLPARASQGLGWVLLIAGIITLSGLAIWEFAIDDQVPLVTKLATGAIGFGILFLLLAVVRQRLISFKNDKYKNVRY